MLDIEVALEPKQGLSRAFWTDIIWAASPWWYNQLTPLCSHRQPPSQWITPLHA